MKRKRHPLWLSIALLGCLGASGCVAPLSLTGQEGNEALEVPGRWTEDAIGPQDSVVFALRHRRLDVSARLHRLPTLYMPEALPVWALAWAHNQYAAVEDIVFESVEGPHAPMRRVAMTATSAPGLTSRFEFRLFNAGTTSYLLEVWGPPAAMDTHGEALTAQLVMGLRLPFENARHEPNEDKVAAVDGLRIRLTDGTTATLPRALWRVTPQASNQLDFALDGRLIEGVLVGEELPYPLTAQRYASVALGERFAGDDTADGPVEIRETLDGPVELTRHHRFVTAGRRGYQILIWTPTDLYEQNQTLIESILESIEVD